jgi:AcrR family transcriptional regulator
MKRAKPASPHLQGSNAEATMRDRILGAAFSAFMEHGYEGTSTLQIATRAKVSKRDIYALFEDKHAILASCISERAKRMRLPLKMPASSDRKALAATLNAFGIAILRGVCDPNVVAVYRLAIAESDHSPEIARLLDKVGRESNRAALTEVLTAAQAKGLFGAVEPATIAGQFFSLILGDLPVRLLLGVINAPRSNEIEQRVQAATEILMAIYPEPKSQTVTT